MSLDTILNIMCKHNLTASELLLFYLTFIGQTENGNPEENRVYFDKWYYGGGKEQLRPLFESLKQKGIICKNYTPNTYNVDEIEFNKNFIKSYFKESGQLGQELYNAYPESIWINGQVVFLRNFAKLFEREDQLFFKYAITIGHNISKHKEILNILDWAKKNDLIRIPLTEFIISKKWIEYKNMMNNGIDNKPSTFDIYEIA